MQSMPYGAPAQEPAVAPPSSGAGRSGQSSETARYGGRWSHRELLRWIPNLVHPWNQLNLSKGALGSHGYTHTHARAYTLATDPLIAVVCSDPTIAWDGRRRSRNSKGDMPETTKTERNSGALPRRPHGFLYQSPHALRAKPKGPRRWPADVGYIREIISRLDRVLRRVLASRKWLTTHLGTTYPT